MRKRQIQVIKPFKIITATISVSIFVLWSILFVPIFAQDFTQGFSADKQIIRGSVVAIDETDPSKVEIVDDSRIEDIHGVVVRANDSPLTLTSDRTGVFVTTTGKYDVLVADINGVIKQGDDLTISSIKGVAMLSDPDHVTLIGTALEDFDVSDPATPVLDTFKATDNSDNEVAISIGRIQVEVGIKPNPNARRVQQVPQFLASIAEAITGNSEISAFRIYAALLVLILASGIAGSLLYSAVRNSIVSIGRNPLSKKSVLAGLAQVVIVGAIIFLSGLVAVYLILKI
jgi:hypothetical protein